MSARGDTEDATPASGRGLGLHGTVIVGAGLAGCAAALRLAHAGGRPLLIERTPHPQPRICGQFVSGEAARLLDSIGVDVRALGAQPTERVRLWQGGRCSEAELPFRSYGLSRRVLDGALQAACVRAGVALWRGHRVSALQAEPGSSRVRVHLQPADGPAQSLHARSVFLAVGKTDLPGVARLPTRSPDALIGLQAHLRLAPEQQRQLDGHVEVMLFGGGYAGLQSVEGGWANLCLLMPRPEGPGNVAQWLARAVAACPTLTRRVSGAQWASEPVQTIFRVPYGHLHAVPARPDPAAASAHPAIWRLGDQAAVIPSFTGDGMAIALHSGLLAATVLQQGLQAEHYHRRLAREVGPGLRLADRLYRLGRHAVTGPALQGLLQIWPRLVGVLARHTRVPDSAIDRVLAHR